MGKTAPPSPIHFPRTMPCLSTRKNERAAHWPSKTPYALMTFKSPSLSRGYDSWSESVYSFWAKGFWTLMPRTWMFRAWNWR